MSKIKDPKKGKYLEHIMDKKEGQVNYAGVRGRAWSMPNHSQEIIDRSKGIKLRDNITKIVITGDSNAKNANNILGWCKESIETGNVQIEYIKEEK